MGQPMETKTTPSLSSRNYDLLKQTAQLFLPAIGTLYFALSQIWGFPGGAEVTGTVAALNVFAGVAVAWLKSLHDASGARFGGTLEIHDTEEGSNLHLKSLDPAALLDADEITFKIVKPSSS